MGRKKTIKGAIVDEYVISAIKESGGIGNKTELSRTILKENLTHFDTVESIRTLVRASAKKYEKKLKHIKKLPAVLILDIETLPAHVRVWGLYKQRIPINNIIKDWCMLSWAAKWMYSDDVMSDVLNPNEAVEHDDYRICKGLLEVINKADIIIAHNGYKFDMKKIKSRLFWVYIYRYYFI